MLNIHWKDWCWSWDSNTLATWCEELTHWKRPWCWERLKAGEGDDRGWDGWMATPTQWTWVWVNSGRWRWRPGMLQSMGGAKSQTRLSNWTDLNWVPSGYHSKLAQTQWLKTKEINSFSGWRPKVWNQDVHRAVLPPKVLEEGTFLSLPAPGGFRPSLAYSCMAPISASIFTWSFAGSLSFLLPSLRKILVTKFRAHYQSEELMLSNCGGGEDSWESLGLQGDQTSQS